MSKKIIPKTSIFNRYFVLSALVLLIGALSYVFIVPKISNEHKSQIQVTDNGRGNDAYANISSRDIEKIGAEGEVAWDLRDPYYFYNKLPIAALVHIDSIDGGRNYSPIFEQYVYPQTIGKMTVLKVYKGDIKSGQQLNYSRLGGIVSYEDYWKGLNDAQRDKILHLNNGKRPTTFKYVHEKFHDDIDIEVGKDYVVFLRPQTSKGGKFTEYNINGMQYGLREVKGSGNDATILNNNTKKWENLGSIVKLK